MNYLKEQYNKKVDLGNSLINGRNKFSPKVQKLISKYGGQTIHGITVVRTPLSFFLTTAFNVVSLGEWNKRMANTPYDKLFHLWLIIDTEIGRFRFEKNEVINMGERPSIGAKDETMNVPVNGLTVNQLIQNAIQYSGADFYQYSVSNNCMVFVQNVLKGSHLDNSTLDAFVKLDTDSLFEKSKGNNDTALRRIANTITDVAGRADVLLQGGDLSPDSIKGMCDVHISLTKQQINKIKRGEPFQLSGGQIQHGGEEGKHQRVHLKISPELLKSLQKSHRLQKGQRIQGGSIRDMFHRVGDAVNKGIDFVKEHAGEAVEAVKKLVPKDAVKSGLTAGATAVGTMFGNPEIGLLASPLISKAVDAGYDHDFTQPLTGRRKGSSTAPALENKLIPKSSSKGDVGVRVPHNLYNLFHTWYETEYLPYHPVEKKSDDWKAIGNGLKGKKTSGKGNLSHASAVIQDAPSGRPVLQSGATGSIQMIGNPKRGTGLHHKYGNDRGEGFDMAEQVGRVHKICVENPNPPAGLTASLGGSGIGPRPKKGDKAGWKTYMEKMRALKGKKKIKGGDLADDIDRALNPRRNGVEKAFDPNQNGVAKAFDPNQNGVAKAFDPNQNGVANYFNQNGKWILGKTIDTLPMLTQVLGSMAGEALGTATGVPLLIPIGATLGSQLGLQAGKYSAEQLHQVAGCGLRMMKGGKLVKGSKEAREWGERMRAKRKMRGGSFLPL
jgi:hypothetical protein